MIKADQPTIFGEHLLTAVSSRSDGTMKLLHGDVKTAIGNRRRFLARFDLSLDDGVLLYVGDQTVWDVIRDVGIEDKGAGMRDPDGAITGDALVTTHKGVALFLYTADCNADIIYDPVKQVIALVHLGWQSTAANLAGKMIEHLKHHYGTDPSDLLIYNGPSIRVESYVFEPPIVQLELPGWQPYLTRLSDGKIGIDLVAYNRKQFITAGVLDRHIEVCPVDTGRSEHYFSHYRASRSGAAQSEGRFASVCMLR